jgi:hypothetical protein
MSTIIVHAGPAKVEMIKEYLTSIHVPFVTEEEKSTYNPDFVKKVERSKKQAKEGKVTQIKVENLWK